MNFFKTMAIPVIEITSYICLSRSLNGMGDSSGLRNCAEGLRQILTLEEVIKVLSVNKSKGTYLSILYFHWRSAVSSLLKR